MNNPPPNAMPATQNDCNVEVNLLADEVSADRIGIKVNVDFQGTCKAPLKERHPETLIRKGVRTTTTKTWTKRIRTTRRKVKKNKIAAAETAEKKNETNGLRKIMKKKKT